MQGLGLFSDVANTVLYRGVETISAGFHTPAAVSRIPALFGFCHGLQRTTRRLFRRLDLWHSSDRQVYRNPIDWRGVLLTFYVPRVSLFFINRHHIVAFSVHKDRFKSHFSQGVNQVAATIPRIEGDRIVSDIYSSPFKERHHFLEHSDDTGGFIRIPASLFANQSHIQGNDPFSNLYCDPQYILPPHRLLCLRRPPIRCVGDIRSIAKNKGIIHTMTIHRRDSVEALFDTTSRIASNAIEHPIRTKRCCQR